MTIDKTIKHCLEVAEEQSRLYSLCPCPCDGTKNCMSLKNGKDMGCTKCAADHRQLAEWLTELLAYRKIRMCGNCRHYVSGTTHFGECHVTSDTEPWVVSVNQTACDTFFDYKDYKEEK